MAKKKGMSRAGYFLTALLVLAFLSALLLSFRFDSSIVGFISGLQNASLNKFMLLVTYAGSSIAVLFLLTSIFLYHKHKRKWLLPLWLSLLFSFIFSAALKGVFVRIRPYYLGFPTLQALIQNAYLFSSSFPSQHAAVAFSALPLLNKEFPRFRFFWLAFACLVGFSRVYFSLHYLSDVLAGAALGYAVGLAVVKLEEKYRYSRILAVLGKLFRCAKK